MYCLDCNYDLRGKESGNCPECGRSFDIADVKSYSRKPDKALRITTSTLLLGLPIGLVFLALFVELQYVVIGNWLDASPQSFWFRKDYSEIPRALRGANQPGYSWEFNETHLIYVIALNLAFFVSITLFSGVYLGRYFRRKNKQKRFNG